MLDLIENQFLPQNLNPNLETRYVPSHANTDGCSNIWAYFFLIVLLILRSFSSWFQESLSIIRKYFKLIEQNHCNVQFGSKYLRKWFFSKHPIWKYLPTLKYDALYTQHLKPTYRCQVFNKCLSKRYQNKQIHFGIKTISINIFL